MRARRSSLVIGGAGFGNGVSEVIDAGTLFPPGLRTCAAATAPIIDVCTNVRRDISMQGSVGDDSVIEDGVDLASDPHPGLTAPFTVAA
jgi:hypothetical protein